MNSQHPHAPRRGGLTPDAPSKTARSRQILLTLLPFAATAAMLTVIQPPFDVAPVAWVSLVPFILACSPHADARRLALAAYLVGLAYWLANLYWIFPITIVGWLLFCLYTALLWPILALSLRFSRAKGVPLFLAAAVLAVGVEQMQGLFLGGFFWRFLAHSQYRNIPIIQIADIFGASAVSFLIAMVNGLFADLLLAAAQKKFLTPYNLAKAAAVCLAVAAAFAYGLWRIDQQHKYVTNGPLVASLQSNVPQSVKRSFTAEQQIFDTLMPHSKAAAKAGAALIVWPETMVQAWLSPQVRALLNPEHPTNVLHNALMEHAKNTAHVLVGAYGGSGHLAENGSITLVKKYNSAFLYTTSGRQADAQYNKIHLVPFGEVLPLRKSLSWFYDALTRLKFIPYNFDYSLDYGSEYTIFEMTQAPDLAAPPKTRPRDDRPADPCSKQALVPAQPNDLASPAPDPYRFAVMICYEDVIPRIARKFTLDNKGNKRLDWLVNISNDGWFVRFDDDSNRVSPSTELSQHAAVCAFRAVENRLAIVRSVNTGISCIIDSSGRIRDGFLAGTLPKKAMHRTGMDGWFADTIPIDTRTTFFSKHGRWLDFCCEASVVMLIIVTLVVRLFAVARHGTRLSRRSNETYKQNY